jgi:hypothetical protein
VIVRSAIEESTPPAFGGAGLDRYYAPLVGVVADVVDPRGLHRVLVEVPGFAEAEEGGDAGGVWCYPRGGGAPRHGAHMGAKVGQTVLVQFVGGDPRGFALWEPAWWALDGHETPDALAGLSPEDAPLVHVLEAEGFTVAIDGREGRRQLVVQDTRLGSSVQVNGELGEVVVSAAVALRLTAPLVEVSGSQVTVNGRAVLVGAGPIA